MVVNMRKLTCSQLTRLGFQDFAGLTKWHRSAEAP
jgi:hypothetical protein